jgi:hypothetical protein
MITTLVKHGDDYAIVIEQHMLDDMKATTKTQFEVFTDGHSLVFIPVSSTDRERNLQETLNRINKRFGGDLGRLA